MRPVRRAPRAARRAPLRATGLGWAGEGAHNAAERRTHHAHPEEGVRAHPRNPRRARGRWPLQSAREEAPHQRATELRQAVLHDRPPENRLTNAWTASAVRGRTGDGAARGEEKNGRACGRPVERRIAAMDGPIIAQAPPLKMKMVLYIRLLLTRWQCVRCFAILDVRNPRPVLAWKSYSNFVAFTTS